MHVASGEYRSLGCPFVVERRRRLGRTALRFPTRTTLSPSHRYFERQPLRHLSRCCERHGRSNLGPAHDVLEQPRL
eukprot:4146511-Prymnesium_polylepis.1